MLVVACGLLMLELFVLRAIFLQGDIVAQIGFIVRGIDSYRTLSILVRAPRPLHWPNSPSLMSQW
jgi:hypothetical protein